MICPTGGCRRLEQASLTQLAWCGAVKWQAGLEAFKANRGPHPMTAVQWANVTAGASDPATGATLVCQLTVRKATLIPA